MNKVGDPIARKIVANLMWRWRLARSIARFTQRREREGYKIPSSVIASNAAQEIEAYNAFVASHKILHGVDP